MDVAGITYKNTYYILPNAVHNLRVHFHELVHVVQWRELGAHAFIMRYIMKSKPVVTMMLRLKKWPINLMRTIPVMEINLIFLTTLRNSFS